MQRTLIATRRRRVPPAMAALAALALLVTAPALARVEGPAFDGHTLHGPGAHALTGARIVQAPGRVIDTGTLVVRDGIIEAVGADVEIPADARVWELEGATLYPGLVEIFATLAVEEPEEDDERPAGLHPNPLVRPDRDAAAHADDEALYKKLRGAGFTVAVLVPEPGIFRGQSAAVSLGDGGVGDNLLRRGVAQNVKFRTLGFGAGYPTSVMGAMALLRQVVADARWHALAQAAYDADPSQERPAYNTSLAALDAAVRGRQPVVFEADDVDQLLHLADLAEELKLQALAVGNGDEYQRLDEVKSGGLTLLVPIKFPDAPKVKDDDDLTLGLDALRHWKAAPENPLRLHEAGVPFVFTSAKLSDPKKLHEHLATAVERGLPADVALAALTTGPAKLLGLDKRIGTLDAGKAANILITEGDLFADKTKIRDVWIDGEIYPLKDVKPPTVEPAGTWELLIKAGDFQLPVTIILKGSVDDLSGTIQSPQGNLAIDSAEVSGDTVYIEVDMTSVGAPGTLTVNMKIEGESASGSGSSPQGDFTFTGNRTAKPEPEVIR